MFCANFYSRVISSANGADLADNPGALGHVPLLPKFTITSPMSAFEVYKNATQDFQSEFPKKIRKLARFKLGNNRYQQ
jgi:hypothetical protein